MSRSVLIRASIAALVIALGAPAAALADASLSTNWAGYAVHRAGVTFRSVSATWHQPAADCNTPYPTYEASWVGIGGYNQNSTALEQIGTELDCGGTSPTTSAAWFELVPDPSQRIRMTIRPGDTINASVTVLGHRVTLKLTDRTRHSSFAKSLTVSAVDVRSAEWIVEVPSECFTDNSCHTLPLTDFGAVRFGGARAITTKGRAGAISSRAWGTSKIILAPTGRTFVDYGTAGEATPSALLGGGSAFAVTYSHAVAPAAETFMAPRARARGPAPAVNPGGRRR